MHRSDYGHPEIPVSPDTRTATGVYLSIPTTDNPKPPYPSSDTRPPSPNGSLSTLTKPVVTTPKGNALMTLPGSTEAVKKEVTTAGRRRPE